MADNRGEVAMPARLHTQHIESGIGTVERHPLDDAGEHFLVGLRCERRHGHGPDYSPYAQCVASACGRGRTGGQSEGFEAFDLPTTGAEGYQPFSYAIRLRR